MIAILEAKRAGLLAPRQWLPNIIAGIIVGVVALPLSMAFAIASGAKPQEGLYTAIVSGIIVSLFGGSRIQIAGPTGAFIVILVGITGKYGMEGLQTATLIAGVMILLIGLFRLGNIVKFIPDPVITGFTAGIGTVIWIGQWRDFFGLPKVTGDHIHEKLLHLIQVFPQLHVPTTLLALFSLALVIWGPKIPGLKRVPGPLTALIAATAIQAGFHFDGITTIGTVFGGIPQELPSFKLPNLSVSFMIEMIGPAFSIAMLGSIESLLSAVVADGMAGTKHDSNQELIGQGVANILCPIFAGFAATGAIARTATNIRNGGTSPIAGVVHAITLVLIILILAPLAVNVPLAVLAAILFMVCWNMSQIKHVINTIRTAPKADVFIMIASYFVTVFVDLIIGVLVGVVLALLCFLRQMVANVEIKRQSKVSEQQNLPEGVQLVKVDGPLFFGAAGPFEQATSITQDMPKTLVIYFSWVPFIDLTGILKLKEAVEELKQRGVRVVLAGVNGEVKNTLEKARLLDVLGSGNEFADLDTALASCKA